MERHRTGLMEFGFLNDEGGWAQLGLHIAQGEPQRFTAAQTGTGQETKESGQGRGPPGLSWPRCQSRRDQSVNLRRAEKVGGRSTSGGDQTEVGHFGFRLERSEIGQKATRPAEAARDSASRVEGGR